MAGLAFDKWEWTIHLFILLSAHLFQYLLITYYVPHIAAGTGDRAVSQTDKGSAFTELTF